MIAPIIKVWNRHKFETSDISQQFDYAISICEWDEFGTEIRPDYNGQRLNLWFFDVAGDREGAATEDDITRLYKFSKAWYEEARCDPFMAKLVIHCFAGISRSSACAMMPLSLYYGSYREAAQYLFRNNDYIHPNSYILGLIGDLVGYDENIWEEVGRVSPIAGMY